MSNLIPVNFGPVSKVFANQPVEDELSAGVSSGYGIISYRGKVWRTKYRGEERDLMRADGDGPRASIEVVILKSSMNKSKIFYKDGYKEGSSESPDCFSANGMTPDISSKNKQANTCDACPMNAWGSRVTSAGKPGKACSDSKRIAIVPLEDLENEAFGGPMLLRVPAASLQDAAGFSQKMAQIGYPLQGIAVRISFDTKEAFPKFVFSAIRPLTDDEAQRVLDLRNDPRTMRVLSETVEASAEPVQVAAPANVFEQPPQVAAPKPAPAPAPVVEAEVEAPKRNYKKTAAPAPAPVVVEEAAPTATSFDDELDAQLNSLLPN
jgi:hypothetical protein